MQGAEFGLKFVAICNCWSAKWMRCLAVTPHITTHHTNLHISYSPSYFGTILPLVRLGVPPKSEALFGLSTLLLKISPSSHLRFHIRTTTQHSSPTVDTTPLGMAVVLGNISPFIDLSTPPTRTIVPDRRPRPLPSDAVLNLFKKDLHHNPNFHAAFESVFDHRERHVKKSKSKVNEVEYENSSDDENGNGNGFEDELGDDDGFDWEMEMRKRVKEIEEMKELEKKAEELQYKVDQEYGAGDGNGEPNEETEEQKRMRVKKELEKVAREQAERRKTAQLMFDLGQKAYGRGMYGRAIEFLEGALTIIPGPTLFGGEIQIWLAMAYEAKNRHTDCIALYQRLERTHPSVSIRRQAAELRYILQAPKLKITQEEMVTIPLIGSSYDSYAGSWSDKYKDKDKDQRMSGSTTNQLSSNRDYLADFLVWKPPVGLEKNRTFWVSLTLWIGLVGAALLLQR